MPIRPFVLALLVVLLLCAGFAAAEPPVAAPPPEARSPFAELVDDDSPAISAEVKQLLQRHRKLLAAPLPRDEETEAGLLRQLAETGEIAALDYLHVVFETYPERRNLVATAVARYAETHRRQARDWRLLVRSLKVVEGAEVATVVRTLTAFPQRATRPRWIRTVLLHALCAEKPDAESCLALVRHWTQANVTATRPGGQLAAWQAWFSATWPDEPEPRLPGPAPGAKWRYEPLAEFLYSPEGLAGDPGRGAEVYQRAECHKCHRFGRRGERMGPDLTAIAGRMQRKEILHSLIYPSEFVSDQYLSYTLVTADGRTLTGVVGAGAGGKLIVLQPSGEKAELPRAEVEQAVRSRVSAMPTGTLAKLTRLEIADLFAYLCAPAD